jgi:hypothetical protein
LFRIVADLRLPEKKLDICIMGGSSPVKLSTEELDIYIIKAVLARLCPV